MKKDVFDTPPAGFKRASGSTGWLVPQSTTQDRKLKQLKIKNQELESQISDVMARLEALETKKKTKK
jgi:hypothetical protein